MFGVKATRAPALSEQRVDRHRGLCGLEHGEMYLHSELDDTSTNVAGSPFVPGTASRPAGSPSAWRAEGIPCNVLAGFHHDHLLVPVDKADNCIAVLSALRA